MRSALIVLAMVAVALASCKKDTNVIPVGVAPTVTTAPVTNITINSATSGGDITSDGGATIIDKGVSWSTSVNPTSDCLTCYGTNDGSGTGPFISIMTTDVAPGTTYHVRARATNQFGTGYGAELTFTTLTLSLATLTTTAVSAITSTGAQTGGIISTDGGATVNTRGVCWGTSLNPTTSNTASVDGVGIGNYVSTITGLTPNTLYHVRAYAMNSVGTAYGNDVTFTTSLGIGNSYQGGVIAYLLQVGDPGYNASVPHGLIAAPTDQSASVVWSLTLTTTGATSQLLGAGQANTSTIVNNQGVGTYAAKLCDDLVIGTYTDWYLPSFTELNKLYLNRTAIGGFAVALYWSSSETNVNSAWLQSFNSDSQTSGTKTTATNYHVRAIRSF